MLFIPKNLTIISEIGILNKVFESAELDNIVFIRRGTQVFYIFDQYMLAGPANVASGEKLLVERIFQ